MQSSQPVTPLADRRLDRFLDGVEPHVSGVRRTALVDNAADARLILRRLRYRASCNWADQHAIQRSLQVWTTPITAIWCDLFKHDCTPTCAEGTTTSRIYAWIGRDYAPAR